ncbi:MAG TPA: LamG-like jellyroll fold domain-containing protein, partial [Candidatus Eisenbacteria bacterium]|nr:LamG-like jellyroll fold domain-containing protein [Candidatus Eisenbacteria bacterium]
MSEYLFNGGFEETVGGDDGIAEGGPFFATDRFGQASSALGLDGIDDRVSAARARFAGGDSISISLWLRVPPNQHSYLTVVSSGQFKVVTFDDDLHGGGQVGAIFLTTCDQLRSLCGAFGKMSRGIWHHVLATYDGVNISIYI